MSTFDKNCLICFKDVNPEEGVDEEERVTGGGEIQPLTLFQLIQHPKGVGSAAHENIIQGHDGEGTCALCHKCAALSKDLAAVAGQIIALQAILGEMVGIIRGRIVESDGEIRSKLSQVQVLDGFLAIRQSLLILSDEGNHDLSRADAEVKMEVEEEETYDDILVDVFPSHLDEDQEFVKEEDEDGEMDSERSFSINPETTDMYNNRVNDITDEEDASTTTPRNRGPARIRQRVIRRICSDSSSSSEMDEGPECDPLQLDDEHENKEGNEDGHQESFKCNICGLIHDSKPLLDNHILQLHSKPEPYTTKQIEVEQNEDAKERKFPCSVCWRQFRRQSNLQIHMMVKHETKNKPFLCSKCDKRFTLKLNLERHLEGHKVEKEKPVVCQVCDTRFQDTARLERHAAVHTNKFHCNQCDRKFDFKTSLERHFKIHMGERPFPCDQCKERFIDKESMEAHTLKIHSTSDERHTCATCGKIFTNLPAYTVHVQRHEEKTGSVTCKTCQEKLENYYYLKRHKIEKHGHKPIACDECGIQVATKFHLKLHKQIHTGDKPHKCDLCDARFTRESCLKNHMISHSTATPFLCHHCGKGFKVKRRLNEHVKRIHTADYVVPNPFSCSDCGKAYPQRAFLEDHIRQAHTGERPFICQVCNKNYAIKSNLTQHMKSHGIKPTRVIGPSLPRSKRDFS